MLLLAAKWNDLRDAVRAAAPDSEKQTIDVVNAGALFAMGLIDELSHAIIARFREELDPAVVTEALRWFSTQLPAAEIA